jgi:RNA polymerase sigma-70 factor (ECF subfamily)
MEGIFRDELGFIVGALLRFGISPEDAEPMAREVMPAIYQSLSSFDPSRPLRPWLFGVIFRQVKTRRRSEQVQRMRFVDVDAIDLADPTLTIEERMIQRQTQDETDRNVRAALAEIDLDRRAVLLARVVYEMSEEETAFALSIPIGTVKTRLRMAKQKLRQGIERREREQKWEQKRKTSALTLPVGLLLANESWTPTVPPAMRARLWAEVQRMIAQPMLSPWTEPPANDGAAPVPPELPRVPLGALRRFLDPEIQRLFGGMVVGGALVYALGPRDAPPAKTPTSEALAAMCAAPGAAPRPEAVAVIGAASGGFGVRAAPPVNAPSAIASGAARATSTSEATSSASPSAAPEAGDPAAEAVLMHSAEMAFERNDIATARKLLEQHAHDFRRSKLGTSRDLLWVRVLLREGNTADAKAKADTIRKLAPHSGLIKTLDALFPGAEPAP